MRLLIAGLLLTFCGGVMAQEGYPLDGTWRGERVGADGRHHTIVLLMEWDGRTIAGTINPGPDSIAFDSAALDPSSWSVRFNAAAGQPAPILFEGTLADLGKYNRTLTGKWTEGTTSFDIRFVRE